ncbi:MAG: tetratricopeptide repeat protein, partial [bacterium]
EISCAIKLPHGFAPDELPARQKYTLPHGQIEIGCIRSNDIFTASCTVSRKNCSIPADKWKKARNDTASSLSKASVTITLVDDIEKLLASDRPTDAISKITAWQKDSPGNGEFHHRLAGVYHKCGLLVSARKEYLKAIDLGYRDLDVYSDLAETYGGFGGVYGHGLKRDDVERVLKTAIETSNDKPGARYLLADSYLRDSKGAMYGKKAPYKDAIAIYETLAAEKPDTSRPVLAMGRCYFAAGDYEKSESCFEKAFELDKLSPDAQSGKWTCAAFLGRVDETVNAVRNGVGESGAQAAELQRIAVKLMFSRKYTEAAALLTKANALSPGKQSQRDLPKLLNKMAKQELPDYATYFDLSTPRKAVISMIAGMFLEDTGKIEKSCSERMKINRDELEGASVALRATLGESSSNLTDLSLDLLANVWAATERPLDDNHIELSLSPPKEQALDTRKGAKITCILRKEGNGEWRICAMGHGTFFAAALGTVASWCIEHNDMDGAKFYVDQIASHIASVPASSTIEGKSSIRDMLDELDREEFTNKITRTLAYTGVSIAEIGKYLESADYLRKAATLEPENVTVRRILGEVLFAGAFYEEAEKAFGMVVARKSNDWRAMQQQITALAQSQKNDAAMALLPKLKEIAPSVQQVAMTEMLVYQEAGKFEAAMKAFQKAKSQLHPVAAFGAEATLLGYMQRKDDLARLAGEGQDAEPNLKPLMNRAMAAAYMLTSDPARAAEQLECLLMKNMEDVSSMMRLAFLMIDKGDYEEAASMAERAASSPLLPGEARLDIGDVCLALGRYDEAESLFEKAREGTKADRGVYRELMLGAYRLIQGRKADAAKCFKNASAAPLGSVWPAPICKFYAGEATFDNLLTIARAQTNPLRRDQFLCETYFYVSMKAIGDGDKQKAIELLNMAIETKSYMTSEFMLAKAQLRLLQAGK